MPDKNGSTALHYAVSNENWEATDVLLQNKADPNVQDRDGFTPLHLAVANNYRQITRNSWNEKLIPIFKTMMAIFLYTSLPNKIT